MSFIVVTFAFDANFIYTTCTVEIFYVVVIYGNKAMLLQDSTNNNIYIIPLIGPRALASIIFINGSLAFIVKITPCFFKILIRNSSCIMEFTKCGIVVIKTGLYAAFKVCYRLAFVFCIGDFTSCAIANIATHIDDEDFISQIYLCQMLTIQHIFYTFCPNHIITRVAKQPHRNNDVAFKCQTLLCFQEFFLEASATAEGYNLKSVNHIPYFF